MALTPTLKRVQQARTSLLLDHPFFGVLALHLKQIEDAGPHNPTAYTNGSVIAYNPAFVAGLTDPQLKGLIAHEVMHCACGHPWRKSGRKHQKWNMACDYAINIILKEAGMKLPENGLLDPQFSGKSAEWIYDRIPDPPDDGDCGFGEVKDAPAGGGSSDKDEQATAGEWEQRKQQALNAAKQRGKLPASLARLIDKVTASPVDWQSVLKKYVQEITNADYTWRKPNKRYAASGMILPSLYSEACGRFVVAIDTSGSIDQILLAKFMTWLCQIVDDMQPSSVDVVGCDAAIGSVHTFERGDHPSVDQLEGGGGTDFRPVFDKYRDDPPAVMIYFTDLYGTFPDDAPDFPIIWAAYGNNDPNAAPFGDVVPLE